MCAITCVTITKMPMDTICACAVMSFVDKTSGMQTSAVVSNPVVALTINRVSCNPSGAFLALHAYTRHVNATKNSNTTSPQLKPRYMPLHTVAEADPCICSLSLSPWSEIHLVESRATVNPTRNSVRAKSPKAIFVDTFRLEMRMRFMPKEQIACVRLKKKMKKKSVK
jgi:hypothetical protein